MNKTVYFVGLEFAIVNYFSNHINLFQDHYNVKTLPVDKFPLISRFFIRNSFLTLIPEFIYFLIFFLINRPVQVITAGPKLGLIIAVVCKILFIKHVHWYTGQVWATSNNKFLCFSYWSDFIISRLNHKLVCDSFHQSIFLCDNLYTNKKIYYPKYGSINGIRESISCSRPMTVKYIKDKISKKDKLSVLFLGRKSKDKGLDTIYEILMQDNKLIKDFNFYLQGPLDIDYPEYDILKSKFIENFDNVYFIDSNVNPVPSYIQCDILILPSKREGFGSVIIESQIYGLPAITSDIYGLRDSFVDGFSGFRCTDITSYINALYKIKSNYLYFSENSIDHGIKYLPANFTKDLRVLYINLGFHL